jgi:hypothetical protein
MSRGFIPRNDEAFDTFFKLITQYVGSKTQTSNPAWTHIPQARVTALLADYGAWYDAFANTFKLHSSVETNEKNRVRCQKAKGFLARSLRVAHTPQINSWSFTPF